MYQEDTPLVHVNGKLAKIRRTSLNPTLKIPTRKLMPFYETWEIFISYRDMQL